MTREISNGNDSGWRFDATPLQSQDSQHRSLFELSFYEMAIVPFLALPTGASIIRTGSSLRRSARRVVCGCQASTIYCRNYLTPKYGFDCNSTWPLLLGYRPDFGQAAGTNVVWKAGTDTFCGSVETNFGPTPGLRIPQWNGDNDRASGWEPDARHHCRHERQLRVAGAIAVVAGSTSVNRQRPQLERSLHGFGDKHIHQQRR